MRVLAVVPARAGSKGVPGKNLRGVAGKPLVSYAITVGLNTPEVAATVVTTDDPEVASMGRAYGAVIVDRPEHLATDEAPMAPVLVHALEVAEAGGERFDVVVLLQPTAPIRTEDDIRAVIALLADNPEADSVVSVVRVEDAHPGRMYRLDGEGRLESLWPEWARVNRQELPAVYLRNGALYAVRRDTLLGGTVIGDRPVPYPMPPEWLANVDDERDLIVADALVRAWRAGRLPARREV